MIVLMFKFIVMIYKSENKTSNNLNTIAEINFIVWYYLHRYPNKLLYNLSLRLHLRILKGLFLCF